MKKKLQYWRKPALHVKYQDKTELITEKDNNIEEKSITHVKTGENKINFLKNNIGLKQHCCEILDKTELITKKWDGNIKENSIIWGVKSELILFKDFSLLVTENSPC